MSDSPIVDLPAKPNLEQQRKRAKDLLRALRAGEPQAVDVFRRGHPRLGHAPADHLRREAKLSDAQWVLARRHGFSSWRRLVDHIEALGRPDPQSCRAFETDLQYYRERAAGMLSTFGTGEPRAVRLVQRYLPGFASAAEAEVRAVALTADDAERILAREHGFDDWSGFAAHIEALRSGQAAEPFRQAFEAIRARDLPALRRLISTEPDLVNAPGTNRNRLLTLAVSMQRRPIVEALLGAGADPDLANNKGWTALHAAAYAGPHGADFAGPQDHAAILDAILQAGAAVDAEAYGDGGTPLAVALFWGHAATAERLAGLGVTPVNLRIASALGRADLMAACFDDDGSLRPEAGYHRAFHRPHSGFPAWRPSDTPSEILDEALGWAARNGRTAAMAVLLDRGASIDAAPYSGTALHWAVLTGRSDAAAWLLDRGADIDRRADVGGVVGVSALHVAAAWGGQRECARLLVERGADLMLGDGRHASTAFGWAAHFGNTAIRDDILDLGSQRDVLVAVLADRPDRVTRLLEQRPDLIRRRGPAGESLLDFAVASGKDAAAAAVRDWPSEG